MTMDSEMHVIRDGCVAVEDGVVVDVGGFEELRRRYGGEVLGGDRKLVMPGLVNCHIHSREHLAVTAFPEGVPEESCFQTTAFPTTYGWTPKSIPKTAEQCMRELENLYTMFHNTSDGY